MSDTAKQMTWQEALNFAKKSGIDESDARLLLAHAGCVDFSTIRLSSDKEMPADAASLYLDHIKKRLTHLPVQYITGEACFCGLDLEVSEAVLIPRPETELLAEAVFTHCTGKTVLDVCTGSGCIAVSVAALGKPAAVTACDISEAALNVATKKAKKNNVDIRFLHGNMFEAVGGEKFDIIVSNPPYIATREIETLMPDVKDFEPRLALDGAEDGLKFYRILAAEGKKHLNPCGSIFLEIGEDQGKTVPKILEKEGFVNIRVKTDYSGLDRIVTADMPALTES